MDQSDEQVSRQEFEELKRRYEGYMERSLAGIFRATIAGRFLECNSSLARILGFNDPQELLGVDLRSLYVNKEDRDRFVVDLTEKGRLINYEILLRHRSGRTIHVLENVFLIEEAGRTSIIEGTVIDVSAIRQAEQEQRSLNNSYRQLMHHVRDGIIVLQEGQVRYANPAAEEMTGSSTLSGTEPDDLLGEVIMHRLRNMKEGDGPVDLGTLTLDGRNLLAMADPMVFMGRWAVQLTLKDPEQQRSLSQERSRARMAEEVNTVLLNEIEEHRRTQEELSRSRRFARGLVDSSLDAIIAVDQAGSIVEFNPAAEVKFGYESSEVIGRPATLLYADELEYDRVQAELARHGAYAGEVRNQDRDRKVFVSFLAASRLFDENGRLLGSMGVSRDITQAKRDQEVLRASEEQYRDLFENATDLIHSVDVNGRFLYVNRAWRNTLGYDEGDLRGMGILDIVDPGEREAYGQLLRRILEEGQELIVDATYIAKDGRRVRVMGNSNARLVEGRPQATRTILRDVTAARIAEEEIREHQARQRALFESGDHMFWTVDRRLALTSFNMGYASMVERLHGVRPELNRDPSRPRAKFATEEYHAFWEDRYQEAFAGGPVRFETDVRDVKGARVCNEIFLSPIFDPSGTVREIFGIGHEITEQRAAENMVREQAARLNSIFGSTANMMVWTLDDALKVTSFNDYFVSASRENLDIELRLGVDMAALMKGVVPLPDFKNVMAHCERVLAGEPQQFEVPLNDRSGSTIWLETFLNPILLDGRVTGISCLAHGITDKKKTERSLLESLHEKEVLLKEVHHRVKNNLQIISSILNLKDSVVGDDPKMRELLLDTQDRIRSMAFIHESLYRTKNFSSIDLADYIDSLSRNLMMSYSVNGQVELERDLEPVLLGLDQAIPCGLILNELISNALKHAFPNGAKGRIRIELKAHEERISLAVSDDGVGLPQGFEPKKHANLGLQLVHTLIDQLDGRITSDAGKGAAYLITFDRIK